MTLVRVVLGIIGAVAVFATVMASAAPPAQKGFDAEIIGGWLGGEAANEQAEITFDDLKSMPANAVVAVNLCSGNRRGLFQPHVTNVQWGYGAMGAHAGRGRG